MVRSFSDSSFPRSNFDSALGLAGGAVVVAILVAKAWLIQRLNINWDEFYFLNHVHEMQRGELALLFQGAFVHAFGWLTAVGPDEIAQIRVARYVSLVLLGLTAILIWRLAIRWVPPAVATLAPIAYLAMSPVLIHGASFRSDSMLAPLILMVLLALTRPIRRPTNVLLAGGILGLAVAINAKALLALPMIALLIIVRGSEVTDPLVKRLRSSVWEGFIFGCGLLAIAALVIGWHSTTLQVPHTQSPLSFAEASASKTLLDSQPNLRFRYFLATFGQDRFAWLLILAGFFASVLTSRWQATALVLAVAPVLVYRNSYPYYYVVILAPACALVPIAIQSFLERRPEKYRHAGRWVFGATLAFLAIAAVQEIRAIRWDRQSAQVSIVSAVHEMFPLPVPYVDRCGMISTFSKTGPFLSTWGLDAYRQKGVPFMPEALRRRAAFVLENAPSLDTATLRPQKLLLPEDRRILESMYVPYWGPIRVAGAQAALAADSETVVQLPFAGAYRLESSHPVNVDGVTVQPGETFSFPAARSSVRVKSAAVLAEPVIAMLIWAGAGPRPERAPPKDAIFTAL